MSGNNFYLALPINDGSLKYFPDNKLTILGKIDKTNASI